MSAARQRTALIASQLASVLSYLYCCAVSGCMLENDDHEECHQSTRDFDVPRRQVQLCYLLRPFFFETCIYHMTHG